MSTTADDTDFTWTVHLKKEKDIKEYTFSLRSSNVPKTVLPDKEIFVWTRAVNTFRNQDSDKEDTTDTGVLFSLLRWNRLCHRSGLKQPWANNPDGEVDGRDICGNLITAVTRPRGRNKPKPGPQECIEWFEDGQRELFHRQGWLESITVIDLPVWKRTEFQYTDVDDTQSEGEDTLYPTAASDLYIKLRNADYRILCGNVDIDDELPQSAYISELAFDRLIKGTYPWEYVAKRVAIRTETGQLCWINLAKAFDDSWNTFYKNGKKAYDREGAWTRTIDPDLELWIKQVGDSTFLGADGVNKAFQATVDEEANGKQTFQIITDNRQMTDLVLLHRSPFHHYETYIHKDRKSSYDEARPARDQPGSEAIKEASGYLNERASHGDPRPQSVQLNASKIMAARGTRVAKSAFKWPNAGSRVGPKNGWPGTSNYPAEWLHRTAYSWGGISGSAASSQVAENLIFGTSECNGIMTRYEKIWQDLFLRHAQLKDKYTTDSLINLKGTLVNNIRKVRHNDPPDTAPWLCYAMNYILRLGNDSSLIAPLVTVDTEFHPFHRPFFTVLESAVDKRLNRVLQECWLAARLGSTNTASGSKSKNPEAITTKQATGNPEEALTSPSQLQTTLVFKTKAKEEAIYRTPTYDNDPHNLWWDQLLGGTKTILVDGISISRLVFIAFENSRFFDVLPKEVTSDKNGNATYKNSSGGTISFTNSIKPRAPDRYMINGTMDIKLYGMIPATLSVVKDKTKPGVLEIVNPKMPVLGLHVLLPALESITGVMITKVALTYRSAYRDGNFPGVCLTCEVTPTGLLQPVADTLKDIFGQENPIISVSGLISIYRDWKKAPIPLGFTLRAELLKTNVNISKFMTITNVGIDLIVSTATGASSTGKPHYKFGFGFFGSAGVHVPCSSVPLRVSWYLKKIGDLYSMTVDLSDEEWTDVLGIRGLNLSNVHFLTSFSAADVSKSILFEIQATLEYRSGTIAIGGSYSSGDWTIEGEIWNVDLTLLTEFYEDVFNEKLNEISALEHSIEFHSLRLRIGVTLLQFEGQVRLDGYTSINATITLSGDGLEIKGSVGNVDLEYFTIEEATLHVFIGRKGTVGRPFIATIMGHLHIERIKIGVGIYTAGDGTDSRWTVYGEVGDLRLSSFAPAVKDSFLDLELKQVALIASNHDEQQGNVPNSLQYPIKRGFQIYARVSQVEAVSSVTRTSPCEVIVSMAYDKDRSLRVGIILPTTGMIKFSNCVSTGPISLELVISSNPYISIRSTLLVKTAQQDQTLQLDFDLVARADRAGGKAFLRGAWINPFGISPDIKIIYVFLQVEIFYATFFETGVPKTIAFGGELIIGASRGKVIVNVDQNPDNQLISATVEGLNLNDLVRFACDVSRTPIPEIPDEQVLYFEKVNLYISTGVTLDAIYYPPGLEFDCIVNILAHAGNMHGIIKREGLELNGSIEAFDLGPLKLHGVKEPNPKLEIRLNPKIQKVYMDGCCDLGPLDAASLLVDMELMPRPFFHFTTKVGFSELLQFDLDANMIGELRELDCTDLDFELSAHFRQDIVDYITSKADQYFQACHAAAQAEFEEEEREIAEEKEAKTSELRIAELRLELAKGDWNDLQNTATNNLKNARERVSLKLEELRLGLSLARKAYDSTILALEAALETAKQKTATAISYAEVAIAIGAKKATDTLDYLIKAIVRAEMTLFSFGDVEGAIERAQKDVTIAKAAVDGIIDAIAKKQRQIDAANIFEKAVLAIELAALEVTKAGLDVGLGLARHTLELANTVLHAALYISAKNDLNLAQIALRNGEDVITASAKLLEDNLRDAKETGEAAIELAKSALELARTSSPEAIALKKAEDLLSAFQDSIPDTLAPFIKALDDIWDSTEYGIFQYFQTLVSSILDDLNGLDARTIALKLREAEEALVFSIITGLITEGKKILQVRAVEIEGQLRGMLSGEKPLKASIQALVGGVQVDLQVVYVLADTQKFLGSLWDAVKKVLEDLFKDVTW